MNKRIGRLLGIGGVWGLLALAGCGGGDGPPPPVVGSATLGAAGGSVDGPDGVRLVVPEKALASDVTFRIATSAAGAPALDSLNAASPIYEVTPHGQVFDQPALFSIPRAAATLPDGVTSILLKASPGGKWRVMNDTARIASAMSADIEGLSWFVLGHCGRTGETTGVIIGAVDCPSSHSLKLELLDSSGTPIAVTPSTLLTLPPLVRVTGPTTLNFRLAWTRSPGTTRVDQVAVTGTGGFGSPGSGFSTTWGAGLPSGGVESTNVDLVRYFSVTIDPSRVAGASLPGGRELRVNANASYSATALRIGVGSVSVGFEFATSIPITVVYSGTLPTITQQPTPASVSVAENGSFTLAAAATGPNLSYEWRYYQGAIDTAVRAAEGINNAASYSSPPVALGFNGRLYYVVICSNRGLAAIERCVASQASPLTVTPFTQAAAFTAQPAPRDIVEREGVSFGATVTGVPTPTLQWHIGVSCIIRPIIGKVCSGTPLADGAGTGALSGATVGGATTATLNLAAVPLAASGSTIALLATQPTLGFSIWSDVTTLTVRAAMVAPAITMPLSPQTTTAGGSATFTVGVSGTEPVGVAWSVGGTSLSASGPFAVAGTTCSGRVDLFDSNRRLVLSELTEGCSGTLVMASASNAAGGPAVSSASLTVTSAPSAPTISLQPAASTVAEDTRATLRVGYGGTGPVTLTLQRQVGTSWTMVSSTTSTACPSPCALQTPPLPVVDNGTPFRVRLSNAQGALDSDAVTITVNMTRAPVFTRSPAAATVEAAQSTPAGTASFEFGLADDTGAFTWQWLVDGAPMADGSGMSTNGVLQPATVAGAGGSLSIAAPGTLTVSQVPTAANGARLSVRITRTAAGQSLSATSPAAVLTVNTGVPPNALTATQVVAGLEWSLVLRPDRTVWGWGAYHRLDGRIQTASSLAAADQAFRPVRMYPAVLSDVHAISGWSNSFWALKGTPGTAASRVLHWGNAQSGADGRGGDGSGSLGSSILPRDNEAAPVEVLERVGGVPRPVDRVCAIAGGAGQLLMIRAVDGSGAPTDCRAGSPKTVWFVGSMRASRPYESTGVAFAMPGLPSGPPAESVFSGQTTSGTPAVLITLEDGRLFGLGANPYGGLGVPAGGSGEVGGPSRPLELPASWGSARGLGMSFYYSLFVVRADGSVMTSGYDVAGELGLGSVGPAPASSPQPVLAETCAALPCADALAGVSAIASNSRNATLALKGGRILGWGNRSSGLLGAGAAGAQPFPRAVPSTAAGFSALSSSHAHALVIGPGGVVYAWGSALRGALGLGASVGDQAEPAMVTTP